MIRLTLSSIALLWFCLSVAADDSSVKGYAIENIENYEFETEKEELIIEDLSVLQRYVLDSQRKELKDLLARKLGVLSLEGNKNDLPTLQQLILSGSLERKDVRAWQSLGIVFGDILVAEHGLKWISYEDDIGKSKALRWKDTDNFVFPITFFPSGFTLRNVSLSRRFTSEFLRIFEPLRITEQKR